MEFAEFVAGVADWYDELSEDAGVTISIHGLEQFYLETEPSRLTQILINLLDNTIKYSRKGDHISLIYGQEKEGEVFIKVKDIGVGIAKEHHELIFRRLYSVDQSRTTSGYGLGLALVTVMLGSLQGRIELSLEPEQGACFKPS